MAIIKRKKRREKKGGGKVQKKRKKKMMIEERCRKSAEEEAKENDDGRRWRSRRHKFRHGLNESKRTKSIKSISHHIRRKTKLGLIRTQNHGCRRGWK